jgi:hypothetical protein
MPRTAKDYSNVYFYKIVCNDLNVTDCYVGHTTHFVNRKRCHKNNSINPNNTGHNCRVYKTIRANGGFTNWSMLVVEQCYCVDSHDAYLKERGWIEKLKANLNSQTPGTAAVDSSNARAHRIKMNDFMRQIEDLKNLMAECEQQYQQLDGGV